MSDNAPTIELDTMGTPTPQPIRLPQRCLMAISSIIDWIFGLASLIVGLALLSIIPLLNFLSLGYLLHASGRVADTGRLRDGLIGIRKASIVGSIVFGIWLVFWPVRFVSSLWQDAELVAPDSSTAQGWFIALNILTVLTTVHVVWACIRGGKIRHFLWPAPLRFIRWLKSPSNSRPLFQTVWNYLSSLRLPYYFWLGLRGFCGALIWLACPVGILIAASHLPPGGGALLSMLGALILLWVVLYLPFLQTYFAQSGRFANLFQVKTIRERFVRAPIAFFCALLITLLFALPLYLLKIELPPTEIAWLPSLFFVVFIFPARLLTGWALGRSYKREEPRNGFLRWSGRLAVLPVAFFYVLVVYLTQYLSWYGVYSLLEQHAFLVPAPLFNL